MPSPHSSVPAGRCLAAGALVLGLAVAGGPGGPSPLSAAESAPPPRRAPFTFATQTLSVPEGFTIEQVAAPPLVNRPIAIAFDEQGRLYATDSSGLSERAPKQFEEKPHRIVRLEDTDGDGRFDRSTVFADRMMFPQGALFHEGSLYVAAPPHIWKLTDTDGDGVADRREEWWDGKTLTGCANDVHGPYLGPDGSFYWTKGAFAEQRHTLGTGQPFVTRAAHIFRARPDGSHFEPVLTGGMDNPVGVAFSSVGERFLSGTFFQIGVAGKRDGLIHSVYGGVYGKENAAAAGHPRTGDLMPIMTHMGAAAPCGSTAYRASAFGADFVDNLFVCYFNLRKVSRHQLVPDGATFRTVDQDFVTSDSGDFHPTDVLEDADGSLLVVDTGGWYKICCPTSQLSKPDILGGIYRIRKTGSPPPADPRGRQVPWARLTPEELAGLLADARPYVQDRALQQLARLGGAAVGAIRQVALASPAALSRRNAVWALARLDETAARAATRPALRDREASVVQAALQAVSLWRDAAATDDLVPLLASRSPAVVRAAAEALGRIGATSSVAAILDAAGRLDATTFTATGTPDQAAARAIEHALIYSLIEIGRRDAVVAALQPNAPPRLVRVALVALDQMAAGDLQASHVLPWLKSAQPMLKQTAGWIVGHHAEWGGALAGFFREQLAAGAGSEAGRADLQTQLAGLAKGAAIQELLAATAGNDDAGLEARLLALQAMAEAGLKETPGRWFSTLAGILGTDDPRLIRQGVLTARSLPLPKSGPADFLAALARLGRNLSVPADVRLEALAIAPASLPALDPELFDFLRSHLDEKQPMLARSAAALVLAKAPLDATQQLALADSLRGLGALEVPKLLPAFERSPSEQLGRRLVAALRQSPGLPGVRANALKPLFAKYPPSVQHEGDALLTLLNADITRQNARIDALLPAVARGDVRRGQAVFNSEKTACSLCHVIGYRGGRLGPDLTNIGRIRNERDLLEAIVYPSATFVRGFEPFVVTTRSGDAHSGIVKKDAADEVVLATGPESEQRIARADIVEFKPGLFSPMPPGMDAVLSPQEISDLVAFLKSRQ